MVCPPYPATDEKEYCGVLNEAENCVLNGHEGWVCA
jgi:hypothetical protein